MPDALTAMLRDRPWILADGATGTNLFNMGLESGDPPEMWNVDHPDRIRALYRGAVDAGSDLFLTNTFGANRSRLALHGAQDRAAELSRAGAALGRDVADAAGRPVIVAGSVGPTGEIMEPMGPLSRDAAAAIFREQAEGLRAGGADVLWGETISAVEELKALAQAAAEVEMPWCITMSFDTAGRTMMGVTAAEMGRIAARLPHPPLAFGANCGRWRVRPRSDRPGVRHPAAPVDRERQCRHPEIRRWSYPLRRHAGPHGRIRRPRPRRGRGHHRRLLRHDPGPPARHETCARDAGAGPAAGSRDRGGEAGRLLVGGRRQHPGPAAGPPPTQAREGMTPAWRRHARPRTS